MELDAVLAQARVKVEAGELGGAAAVLDAAPPELKARATWLLARGTVALEAGQLDAGVKWLEQAADLEPELPEVLSNLGGALLEQAKAGDAPALTRAKGLLERACALGPKLPGPHTNLGMARLLAGDAAGALEAFEQALRRDGRHVPALYDKAAALNALGRLDECLAALDAVLAVAPGFQPALESRANTLRRLGR
jgi:tetratricopeptide (TPR) repeat protein